MNKEFASLTCKFENLIKTFDCTRLVYNHYLEKVKTLYKEKKEYLSCFDMIKDLKNCKKNVLIQKSRFLWS